jgi:hypothetical protein
MMAQKKIDRPLVKMTRTKDDGGYDFHWYKTMMGKQSQINKLLRDQIELLEGGNETLRSTVKVLQTHRDMLQTDNDRYQKKYGSRVFVFQPWNLIKDKTVEDVGD